MPWDPFSLTLYFREEINIPIDHRGRLLGRDDRGSRLEARLCRYRRFGDDMCVSPVACNGFIFERMRRSVVARTGALPGRPLGLQDPVGLPGSPM